MKKFITIVMLIISVIIFSPLYGQLYSDSLDFEGTTRYYDVFLPQNYQPEMPLVLCLHGINMELDMIEDLTLMHEVADTSGFVLVYPLGHILNNGMPSWNNGTEGQGWVRCDKIYNDVGFISVLIDTIKADYDIDMSRIYCSGFSMGGAMTYRLSIEMGHRFAALGVVAGKMNDNTCNLGLPMRPIPLMHFHGTDDINTPYVQGPGNLWSVNQILNFWTQNNNCTMTPDTVDLPDIDPSDSTTVQKISFTDCSDSAHIIHYKILNGGHQWPKFITNLYHPIMGYTNRDIEANVELWNFFKNYDNPLANIVCTNYAEISHRHLSTIRPDTLLINAYTSNPENHPAILTAVFHGQSTAYTDSITLYDDGMHGDRAANDNIWGNFKNSSRLPEGKYFVDIYTRDLSEGTTQKYHYFYSFLKLGPVVFDHFETNKIPAHGVKVKFKYALRNEGKTATISNLTTRVTPLDTFATFDLLSTMPYNDIPAGSTMLGNKGQYFTFDIGNHTNVNANFRIDIFKDEFLEWSDTFSVLVTGINDLSENVPETYVLKQNYPNPFNPETNIQFQIPESEFVTLKIYNLLGQEVATLVSEKLQPGKYTYTWDAGNFASGVYYYTLDIKNFHQTKKLILLR